MPLISIVVPCYNEAKNIPHLVDSFKKLENFHKGDIELLLVDNGSSDDTFEIITRLACENSFIKKVKVDVNIGYGNGIIEGVKLAQSRYISWTHADLQSDPMDFSRGIDEINNSKTEFLFIKGARKNRPKIDAFFTFFMSVYVSALFGRLINDISAQPTIFHRSLIDGRENDLPKDFALDMYVFILAKKLKFSVKRFNVCFKKRLHGNSSWNTGAAARIKLIKRYIFLAFKTKISGLKV